MKVLIIGGTRFMGPHVVNNLVSRGHEVAVFHRGETPTNRSEDVTELLGDRNRLSEFADRIMSFEPEIILDMMLLSEEQTRALVAVASGVARRLVIASSCDVYYQYDLLRGAESGPFTGDRVNEESQLREKIYPYRNDFPDKSHRLHDYDKIPVERIVMSQSGLAGTVLRLPVVYGPGDYQHRFHHYLRRMQDNRPSIMIDPLHSRLRLTRGYCENCGLAISQAITNDNAAGRIYNVGEKHPLTERDWIEQLADLMNWSGEIVERPEQDLPDHLKSGMQCGHHLDINTDRIREELGFSELIDRAEALRRTIEWELENPPEAISIEDEYAAEDRILADI